VKNDPEILDMVTYISGSAGRMETLITELLDTAALEMGRIDLKMKQCSPDQILRKSVQEQQLPAEKKQQQLQLKSGVEVFCNADPNRLKQVFENILSNAIKYSPAGARIEIESYVHERHWCVDVKDQGPGFSAEDLKNLYGFFQQLSARPTAGENSTGVGLAIVKQIVELHGGKVHLKTNTSSGSTFCVCLPLASKALG
jgi:signal transduction histidine kinase